MVGTIVTVVIRMCTTTEFVHGLEQNQRNFVTNVGHSINTPHHSYAENIYKQVVHILNCVKKNPLQKVRPIGGIMLHLKLHSWFLIKS